MRRCDAYTRSQRLGVCHIHGHLQGDSLGITEDSDAESVSQKSADVLDSKFSISTLLINLKGQSYNTLSA